MSNSGDKATILVVDDTPENIDVLSGLLSTEYDVKVAKNGETALRIAQKNFPDLILLDVMMPGIDGYEVCRRLKADERTNEIPVIFITAKTEEEDEVKGFNVGGGDYITKPISPPIVMARVRNHLMLKQAREHLKNQNELLKENERLREDVERISRHDLKTPVIGIIAQAQILAQGITNPIHLESIRIIEKSGYQTLNMINLSSDLFKMETGTYELTPSPVNILNVIGKIFLDLKEMAANKRIGLKIVQKNSLPTGRQGFYIYGEEVLCYSLFANLIKNAIEASPVGKDVIVTLQMKKNPIIRISNQGVVLEDLRAHFFEKYATKGKSGGTGLGTYSAKVITETQRGHIALESSPQKGTVISVELPKVTDNGIGGDPTCPDAPMADLTSLEEEIRSFKVICVLIADDDAYCRKALARFLDHPHIQVEFAENGEKAVERARARMFSLILMDLEMPAMAGPQAVQEIRKLEKKRRTRKTPIIALSAHDEEQIRRDALEKGFSDYLVKPVTRDILLKTIVRYAEKTPKTDICREESTHKETSDNESPGAAKPYHVAVDQGMAPIIPDFIESRQALVAEMKAAFREENFREIARIAHKFRGACGLYGFDYLEQCGKDIEASAKSGNRNKLLESIERCNFFFKHLAIEYV